MGATLQYCYYHWKRCWNSLSLETTFSSCECIKQGAKKNYKSAESLMLSATQAYLCTAFKTCAYFCRWGKTKGHSSSTDPTQQILDMPNSALNNYCYIVYFAWRIYLRTNERCKCSHNTTGKIKLLLVDRTWRHRLNMKDRTQTRPLSCGFDSSVGRALHR